MSAPRPVRDARSSRRPSTARGAQAARQALRGESVQHEPSLPLGRNNWLFMGAGVLAAGIGYALLARGDISLAPALIVVGYCALIPVGIVWRDRPRAARKPGTSGGE